MMSISSVIVWFVLMCCVDSEIAESPPASQLLDRIVALENRDYEHSKRILLLEQRVKLSEERVQQLTMANEDLIKQKTDQLKEINAVTTKLQLEMQALKSAVGEKEELIFNLQSKVKEFDEKLEEQAERIKETAWQNFLDVNLAKQSSDEIPLNKVHPKSYKDEDMNNTDEPQERHEDESFQAVNTTNKISSEHWQSDDGKLLHKLRAIQRFVPAKNNAVQKEKRVTSVSDMVAFHAEVTPFDNDHFGTHDYIKFDDVRLNLGGGYHSQHGLFIAPKRGLYLFSVTVAVKPGDRAWADVMKNGVRLGSVLASASVDFGEGSTTLVTLLDVSDEVWVVHTYPADGSFWVVHKEKRVATNNDLVAFHAEVTPHYNEHFGTNDNIKFDNILLNLGGGYHNQHGLFIAPKRGLYLFSVTVAVKYNEWAWCDVLKNGVRMVGVLAQASINFGGGSTTFVTLLDVSDEVWVVHTNPPDGSFWGNGHTSFTGVLISET